MSEPLKARTYLPALSDQALENLLFTFDWSETELAMKDASFERVGLDRFFRIHCDLLSRNGTVHNLRVLDVGCNNGLIARAFAMAGAQVQGIDSLAVDNQGLYVPLDLKNSSFDGRCTLQQADLLDLLRDTHDTWDVVLLLSVVHHWRTGYAMSGEPIYSDDEIAWIFSELSRRCTAIYIECPCDEPGFRTESGLEVVERYIAATHDWTDLGYTIGPAGYQRRLVRLGF